MIQNRPVFFVHSGNQDYLGQTIKQAEKTNKTVYLLGDDSNRTIAANWFDMKLYLTQKWEQFKKIYIHMSSNPYEFELNCFRRFFVVYEFAKKMDIKSFFMVDSDCLVYSNFSELNLSNYDAGLSIPKNQENYDWTASPHNSYWTLEALESFLNYLFYEYTKNLKELEIKWNYHQKNNIRGGICDMTLLYLWATSDSTIRILNTTLGVDKGVFDHFLSVSEGYKKGTFPIYRFCEMKHFRFVDGKAYFKDKNKNWIRTYTIHAQGKSKIYIKALSLEKDNHLYYVMIKIRKYIFSILRKGKLIR